MFNIKRLIVLTIILLSFCSLFSQSIEQLKSVNVLYNVSVIGAVRNPGVYMVPPSCRVSQAIKMSNIIKDTLNVPKNFLELQSLRNIEIKRGAEKQHIDLEKFFVLGDEDNNPYIMDGDIIIVQPINRIVSIFGAVVKEGDYELAPGDKVLDIIQLAMGLREDSDLKQAEIIRFVENNIDVEVIPFNLDEILENPQCEANLILKPDDRIYIRSIPKFHPKKFVTITGEIKYPGIYSIEKNKTTLWSILKKAGGPTADAYLKNAVLNRKSIEDIIDPEFERLKKMSSKDMTYLEYNYYKTKSRQQRGKFAVDFSKLWEENDEKSDVLLKNNDAIHIPDKTVTIAISGQVKNPGLIPFIQEKNYLYYVEQAGGFSWNVSKSRIRLIRASNGEWIKPNKNTIVEVGDMIFVPEKPKFKGWEFALDALDIVSKIATLYIVLDSIINK